MPQPESLIHRSMRHLEEKNQKALLDAMALQPYQRSIAEALLSGKRIVLYIGRRKYMPKSAKRKVK